MSNSLKARIEKACVRYAIVFKLLELISPLSSNPIIRLTVVDTITSHFL
jgi:hypothetical protein